MDDKIAGKVIHPLSKESCMLARQARKRGKVRDFVLFAGLKNDMFVPF